jgi:TRAP-type transport system small permease protein
MDAKNLSDKLGRLSRVFAYAGATALFFMVLLTTTDVVGRYLFNAPITGVFEITEFLVLMVIFSFIGYTQSQKNHIAVDLVFNLFPKKAQHYIELINHLVCLLLMGLIVWMGLITAMDLKEAMEKSPNLAIPTYPFAYFMVAGCVLLCIEYVRSLIQLYLNKKETEES